MRLPRPALVIVLAAATLAILGYFAAAAMVYDEMSRVEADCGGRFEGQSPAAWSPPGWAAGFDASPWFVPSYEEVRIPGRDPGIDLHAWWLPPTDDDGPAVVLIPGVGSCIRDREILLPAGMLHRLGYGVLLLDLRDHGASSIEDGRYAGGTEEYRDVMAAVDWLVAQGVDPGRIGALGTSLGATVVIIAGGQDQRIAAVWSDTAYADVERRVAEELEARGYPRLLAPAATLVARLISGDDLGSHTALGEVENLSGRRLFITHGVLDDQTYVSHAGSLVEAAETAGVIVDAWLVPDAGHVAAMFQHPEEYEARLGRFFGVALGR